MVQFWYLCTQRLQEYAAKFPRFHGREVEPARLAEWVRRLTASTEYTEFNSRLRNDNAFALALADSMGFPGKCAGSINFVNPERAYIECVNPNISDERSQLDHVTGVKRASLLYFAACDRESSPVRTCDHLQVH